MFGAVLVVVAALLVATLGASSSPRHSGVVTPTNADRAALLATFRAFKIDNHEMKGTDKVTWASPVGTKPVGPLIAYDEGDDRYWALANFNLVLPASYEAEVSFQDGGSAGIFYQVPGRHWVMTGHPGLPVCPAEFPALVSGLWGLIKYGACG